MSAVEQKDLQVNVGQAYICVGKVGSPPPLPDMERVRRGIAEHREVQRFDDKTGSRFPKMVLELPGHIIRAVINTLVSKGDLLLEKCAQVQSVSTERNLVLKDCPKVKSVSVGGTFYFDATSKVEQISCGSMVYFPPQDGSTHILQTKASKIPNQLEIAFERIVAKAEAPPAKPITIKKSSCSFSRCLALSSIALPILGIGVGIVYHYYMPKT